MNDSWRRSRVSADGTHHVVGGRPLYAARFLRALSFHEPGLAAVCDRRGAWHIDSYGRPAYPHVFEETFGFYENLAAVRNENGWFHIKRDGTPAYSETFDWCGNFQGGRAVVRRDDGYFHLLPDGRALYETRFLYAGDFRERRAVVRLAGGLCAHINEDGEFAHPHRYRDLGVYHKGLACARDAGGWTHIDADGVAVYQQRFAQAEPFYNGCALVEILDGKTEVIDECGRRIHAVTESPAFSESENRDRDLFQSLSADMAAYWKTYTLAVMSRIAAADKFPLRDEDAAGELGLPVRNAEVFLHALTELDVVRRSGGEWRLTAKGEFMRPGHPLSLSDAALVWATFAEAGAGRWSDALQGEGEVDAFSAIAGQPHKVTALHRMLAAYAKHDYAALPDALPLAGVGRLIDAGGGSGVAARLIANANKEINIVVLDRPEALALLEKETGFDARISGHPCDIFSPWNLAADAVMMARVLHDWNDRCTAAIMNNARAAVPACGKLFIVERIKHGEEHGLCSFHLLTVGGGRERTLDEYRDLMDAASFRFLNARPLGGGVSVLTGEAV